MAHNENVMHNKQLYKINMKNTLQNLLLSDNISEEINNMFKELEYDPRSNGAIIRYDS